MKRLYMRFLLAIFGISFAVNVYSHDAEIDGIYYNLVSKVKQATVTYQGESDNAYIEYSGSVSIPSTVVYEGVTYEVTSIGSYAFSGGCTSLTSVTIPSSVTSIGASAFSGCTGLTSINIPSGVTSIEAGSFQGSSSLTSIAIPLSVTSIGVGAFSGCTSLTSVTIPSSVTSIGVQAFQGCSSLTTITIPSSMTSIGGWAFYGCSGLTSITIPSSVAGIEEGAFQGCTGLTSVTIEGSPSISTRAFSDCSKLTTVTLNGGYLGSKAFANCPELMDVYCNSETPPSASSDAFEGSYIDYVTLHVPSNALNAYANDSFWGSNFKEIVTIDTVEFPTTIALTDGDVFEGLGLDRDMEEITYTRTFSNTNWQALYVPFTMEYSEWAADFDVARINDIHQFDDDDNGTIDRTELEVIKVTSGSIEANTPYLIRAKEAGEKTFTLANRTLYKAEEKSYTVSSWNTLFTFTGTYSGVTGNDMVSNAYYALGDGALRQAASTDNALSPYRWYVAITDRNGAQKGVNEVKLKVWGEDATGIDLTPAFSLGEGETSVYDLSGRRVEKATKGLYIVNGKKMMVR